MKQFVPFNALVLVAAIALAVMLGQIFTSVKSYPVAVKYALPVTQAVPAEKPPPSTRSSQSKAETAPDDEPEADPEPEDYSTAPEPDIVVQFPLDINSASVEELMLIPKIGDAMAQRIVQYRAVLGGYTTLEQLMNIKLIGETTYGNIAPYLIIEDGDD